MRTEWQMLRTNCMSHSQQYSQKARQRLIFKQLLELHRSFLGMASQAGFHDDLCVTCCVKRYMPMQGQTSLHWATRSLLNIWLWPHGLSRWDVAILSLMPCTVPATLSTPLPTGKQNLLRIERSKFS
jgi:hypothetical protein